jgi:hypothetical protein
MGMAHRFQGGLLRLGITGFLLVAAPGARVVADAQAPLGDSSPATHVPAVSLGAVRGGADAMARPSPVLTPGQVVDIVLTALQHNDVPAKDRGIAVTFEFASPANRDATGPFPRFAALVKNPSYRAILNHRRSERGDLRVVGDQARQRVTIVDANGDRITYLFMLSRQSDGPYKGCWMTDGVVRETELRSTRYERLTVNAPAPAAHGPLPSRG